MLQRRFDIILAHIEPTRSEIRHAEAVRSAAKQARQQCPVVQVSSTVLVLEVSTGSLHSVRGYYIMNILQVLVRVL